LLHLCACETAIQKGWARCFDGQLQPKGAQLASLRRLNVNWLAMPFRLARKQVVSCPTRRIFEAVSLFGTAGTPSALLAHPQYIREFFLFCFHRIQVEAG
jgi:hypothetical protein